VGGSLRRRFRQERRRLLRRVRGVPPRSVIVRSRQHRKP
jgi:hypothetical protein